MIASAVFLLHSSARTRAPQLGITGKPPAVRRYPAVRASARFRLQSAVRWKRSGAPAKPYFAALPGLGGSRLTCLYDSKGTPGGPTGLHATLGHYPMPHGIAKVYMRWSAVTTPSCPPRGSPRVRCDRATGGSAVPSQWPQSSTISSESRFRTASRPLYQVENNAASESVRYRRALAPPLDHQAVIGAGCEQVIAGRTPLILTTFSARLF